MRIKPGRPDIRRYRDHFRVPPADDVSPLSVTFLGVATLLFDDGSSALMTDGFFSRPSLSRVLARPIAPDHDEIQRRLAQVGVSVLDAVLPVHSHYDHALDSAVVAERTGAVLIGGESTANIGRGHRLADDRVIVAAPGRSIDVGNWTLVLVPSAHCPPDRFPGTIDRPLVPPARVSAWKCGEAWSIFLTHRLSGRTALVQGSAGFVRGALTGRLADVAFLGVGQLGLRPEAEIREYWRQTVRAVGARRVVLIHWDDFFRPLSKPLRPTAYAGDDLDVTMRVLGELARADGVELWLPHAWQRSDPWKGM